MDNAAPTPDEQPKKKIAKKVMTQKRLYFMPDHSVSLEATSVDDAVTKVKKLKIAKDGDAN